MPTTQTSAITPEVIKDHGITPDEYERIKASLGCEPSLTELGIFSVMWSEHCSYKSSRVHLKRLPTRAPQVVQGPGENAGIIDIGDGWAARSRWSLTITRLLLSRFRAQRRVWAASCAIFLQWERALSR